MGEQNEFTNEKEDKTKSPPLTDEEENKRWEELLKEVAVSDRQKTTDSGRVILVGSGIRGVGQFTLETIAEIKAADCVFYSVADPITELYIKELKRDAWNMNVLYEDGKLRYSTYIQMAECILHMARRGKRVVGVFYGHPAPCMMPCHRVMEVAEQESIDALMLAAPSAEDCLFADIGVDPSYPGTLTLDATDFVLHQRKICTDRHAVIWQVGLVVDPIYHRTGYSNKHFPLLIKTLQEIYGDDYEITHYIAAQYPTMKHREDKVRLSDFLNNEEASKVTTYSTFYIPPKTLRQLDIEVALQFGVVKENTQAMGLKPVKRAAVSYGKRELNAIAELKDWAVPDDYQYSLPSELSDMMMELSTNPKLLEQYEKNGYPTLSNEKQDLALKSKNAGLIRLSMKE